MRFALDFWGKYRRLDEAHRRQLAGVVQLCRALGGGWTEQADK